MADLSSNSPSKYHLVFSQKPSKSGNIAVLISISSIWEDEQIEKLKNNQWKCLRCDIKFQGINAKKALAHVIGTKCMHIKRCTASIDKTYLSRCNELHIIKASKKRLLNSYSQKMTFSVSRLQDKSSEFVESNIQRNSRSMYSSNIAATSFSTSCSKSPEINPTNPQKG